MAFVATHAQLQSLGLSKSTITRRIGPRGPWQRLLPGVVLTHRGTPTRDELLRGALAFCGEDAVVTGWDALLSAGLRQQAKPQVYLLIPADQQRKSFGYASIERTRKMPEPILREGIPYAPVPRALVDACRRSDSLTEVRHLVATTVQARLCTVDDVRDQVRAAARARTALARVVLAEVADGVRSGAEAVARSVMSEHGVPAPLWNVRLCTPDGRTFLTPDAYWPQFGAALEIDSFAWHLSPQDYLHTIRRSRRMIVNGVLVMHFAPVEISAGPARFAREVMALLEIARRTPLPEGIFVAPAA